MHGPKILVILVSCKGRFWSSEALTQLKAGDSFCAVYGEWMKTKSLEKTVCALSL